MARRGEAFEAISREYDMALAEPGPSGSARAAACSLAGCYRPARAEWIDAARVYSFGPPARTSADACASYFLKLSRNSDATRLAFSS